MGIGVVKNPRRVGVIQYFCIQVGTYNSYHIGSSHIHSLPLHEFFHGLRLRPRLCTLQNWPATETYNSVRPQRPKEQC